LSYRIIKEKITVKIFFKLLLSAFLFSVLFIAANALLPFSQGFKELGSSGNPMALVFLFLSGAWTCFTVFFVI